MVLLAIAYVSWFFYTEEERMLQSILKLDSLPNSVSSIECQSLGITDVMTTCSFTIESSEFEMLLNGWHFKKESSGGTAHNRYAKLGTDFLIDEVYIVSPKEFEHGGSVSLVVDKSKKYVMAELYIE